MSAFARTPMASERRRGATTESPSGTLFVVATPIGNLEDITLRALRVLGEVALVAAEDTRRSSNLLRHHGIQTPLVSVHEHNERLRIGRILAHLRVGESVALVSDAGTPGISDPGAALVRAVRDAGYRVEPIPGPSAVTAVLSASGIRFERFAFAGFLPIRSKDRSAWLQWVRHLSDVPVVCFEAPHRIQLTLQLLRHELGNRPIIVAREITKVHEEWVFLSNNLSPALMSATSVPTRGEFVLVIGPEEPGAGTEVAPPDDRAIAAMFGQMTAEGLAGSRRAAVKAVAARLGLSVKMVYDALERVKNNPQT